MASPDAVRQKAERSFAAQHERAEKGSAMTIIKAEQNATVEKTLRLKALRLAQEAAAPEAPKKVARRKPVKR